jgi:hypothetical protein
VKEMYTVILRGNIKLNNVLEISLSESIDSIAYTAHVKIVVPQNLPLMEGDTIEIIKNEDPGKWTVFKGVIWVKNTDTIHNKIGSLTCKERTIYIEKSEDEYLFNAGTTATQRAKQMCRDWGIPIGNFADTGIPLSKTPPKIDTIYGMMLDDLRETAEKGGGLFRYRMQNKLDLIQIGSNEVVHDISEVLENIGQLGSLEGAISKVKVLGKKEEGTKSPVLGVFEKDTDKIGTLQKVIQDEKIQDVGTAKNKAEALFSRGEGRITVRGTDIPDIRAGDKVKINGFYVYVTSVVHKLGEPGSMELALESIEQIRRKYYADS